MERSGGRNWMREIALACFFVSGASGLIYEVVWTRMLGLVFGNTVFATSTVLTAFMAGLALGSYLSGRYADRISRSLRTYAFLEIGIGFYSFLIPLLIKLIESIYLPLQRSLQLSFYSFSLIRFILCFFLLLIPATLMGATMPIFSKFYVERGERFGHGIGRVYALNTFGAFLGVVLSGFFMIERLGVRSTINVAVAGNIGVAIVCLLMDLRGELRAKSTGQRAQMQAGRLRSQMADREPRIYGVGNLKTSDLSRREQDAHAGAEQGAHAGAPLQNGITERMILTVLMIGFGISGFAALVYEVAWTRILAMIIGSSVHAFSIMLATFLIGLALGGFLFSMIAKRKAISLIWFGAAELIIGLTVILTLPVFERMPFYFVSLFEMLGHNYAAMELSKFLLSSLVMIVPTVLLGSLFPMVTQICTRDYSELGRKVGTVYSVNTLGNIGGSFMAGFILIPYIGIRNSVILAAALNMAVGCAMFLADRRTGIPALRKFEHRAVVALASAVVGIFSILAIPSWDKMIISSGPSVYASKYADIKGNGRKLDISGSGEKLLYYKEGTEATIAVRKRPQTGTVVMSINGKVDASDTGDMYTQLMLGHIPLLLSPNPKTALVIGLGSGVTLGAAAQHPLTRIDCVEIEPAVVEASKFFNKENRNVLEDPRVNLIINDGRNHLAVNLHKYDVIISEPSNLWLAGMANLFSLEFYQLCKERLTADGILCQWSHIYHISSEDLKVVVNTFRSVFPHTSIWFTILGDIMMVGSREKITIDYLQLVKRYNIPGVWKDLQRLDIREPLALLSCYLLDEEAAERFAAGSRINTDNRPILEFSTPRSLYLEETSNSNHNLLWSFRTGEFPKMKNFNQQRVTSRANFWYHLGAAYDSKGMSDEARRHYEKAISVDTDFAPAYVGLALNLYGARASLPAWKEKKVADAIKNLKKAIALDPAGADAYYNLAQMYHSQGLRDEAISNYESAIKLSPQPWRYQQKLADLLVEYGDYSAAIREYEAALKGKVNRSRILHGMAKAYREMGMTDNAIGKIQEAIALWTSRLQPTSLAPLYEELGDLYEAEGEYEKAASAYRKLIELEPNSGSAHLKLSRIYRLQGDLSSSRKEAKKAEKLQ